jgi:pyridoxine 5-phosphate synthase
MNRLRLGVNIDHVATIRNARGENYPSPARAAEVALLAGADGITAHLREDRRHISDADIEALAALCRRRGRPLNFEMAPTEEMEAVALAHRPHATCLVPERREEVTTEGGLDVAGRHNRLTPLVGRLKAAGVRVSLFVEPDARQIAAAAGTGAQVIELHAGAYCLAVRERAAEAPAHLRALRDGAIQAQALGLEVHAGHGIDYETVPAVAAIPQLAELNIGHFLIGEAIFTGLDGAIRRMRTLMDAARPIAAQPGAAQPDPARGEVAA